MYIKAQKSVDLDSIESNSMFCTTCKELERSNQTATIGTSNFRRSTLDRHGESREHRGAVEAKVLCGSMMQATEKATNEKETAILSAMRTMYFVVKMNLPICHYGEMVEFLRFQGMLLFC